MKTLLKSSLLTSVLVAASSPCFASWSIGQVSKDRAKALGVAMRSKASGTNAVLVDLEFKTEGALKRFSPENNRRVELTIKDGEKLLLNDAALREKRSSAGSVVVSCWANRAYLDKIALIVVVGEDSCRGLRTNSG